MALDGELTSMAAERACSAGSCGVGGWVPVPRGGGQACERGRGRVAEALQLPGEPPADGSQLAIPRISCH
eukprot:1551428-Rhodomonas_salina.1